MRLLLLPLLALATGCTHQASSPAPTQRQLSWEAYKRQYPDTFIASTDRQLAAEAERLRRLGLAQDLAALETAVDRHLPPGNYTLQATGASAAVLRRQRVQYLAQFLVDLGYGAVDVADRARAKALVERADRLPAGLEKGDAAWLSPTIVLADFVEVVTGPPDSAGRRFSTIRYRVVEPLKNAPPAGTLIRMPGGPTIYPDGTTGMSTNDMEMIRPGRYIIYLSQLKMTRAATAPQPVDLYARVFGPLREFGGKFVPVGESSHPEVTLDDLRASVHDQLCSQDHVPAASASGPSQSC